MKRIITILIVCVSFAGIASAQTDKRSISVKERRIVLDGDNIQVGLDLEVGRRAARSGHTLVYRPCITDGVSRWTLPELVVRHARARVAEKRHAWVAGESIVYDDAIFAKNGESVSYTATVPFQPWMEGSELIAESIEVGCCGSEQGSELLAELPVQPKPVIEPIPDPIIETPVFTTGDRIAKVEPWVLPAEEFNRHLPQVMFDDDREGALKVHFAWDKSILDLTREDNAGVMEQLLSVIDVLEASSDSRVAQIVVAGFASPEGTFAHNDRLAFDRAAALKEYVAANSGLDADAIYIHNGAEDWGGLRDMVEKSDLADKEQIIDIIDNTPIWDSAKGAGREKALMKLDGGRTYRYLLRNFFPELRTAAYIKVFYENK